MTTLLLIDTIRITLDLSTLPTGIDYIQNIKNNTIENKNGIDVKMNKDTYSGNLRNLRVDLKGHDIIVTGSFSRFLKNNNITPLTLDEIKETVETISSELKVPIRLGIIRRLDLAEDFYLTKPVMDYINLLSVFPMSNIMEQSNGKYFITNHKSILFYDKIKELKTKDPVTYKSKFSNVYPKPNLIRYEFRLKNVKYLLKIKPPLRVAHLYSEKILRKIAKLWFDDYCKVQKENQLIFNPIKTPADYKKWMMYNNLKNEGGISKGLKDVDQLAKSNNWSGSKKGGLKRFLMDLNQSTAIATSSELVEELDLAIANSKTCKFLIS